MYNNIDLAEVNRGVNANLFKPLDYRQIPQLFLGFIIKNNFEYNALRCTDETNDIAHLCGSDGIIEPVFLRGIFIEPPLIIDKIIEQVNKIKPVDINTIFNQYIKILSQFNLSCNNTYAYLLDGMFPIDIYYLEQITSHNYAYYSKKILDCDAIPWFFQPELKLCILTKSNTYIHQNI
jgi:hypothetical protein